MSSESSDRSFRCACVQFDVRRGEVAHNLARVEAGLRAAAAQGARLAVLPEMWTTSFGTLDEATYRESAAAEETVTRLSAELGLAVVGSAPFRDGDATYNRATVVDHGTLLGEFRKIHLFSLNAEQRFHAAGTEPLVVDTPFARLGVIVCYDIRFPELVRHYFERQAEVLVVPAQWPEARADHWRILLKARAIENQMFVVGCNRTGQEESLRHKETLVFPGDSRIVDPMGTTLVSGAGEEEPLVADLEMRRVRVMRRILPISKDRRPDVYERLRALDPGEPPARRRRPFWRRGSG